MEQKTKFILIGLVGISIIFAFLFIQALSSKQQIKRQRDDLKEENITLGTKVSKLESGLRDYANKVSALKKELDDVAREKKEIENKYEVVNKEKDELVQRLGALPAVREAAPTTEALPQAQDAYWAGVVKAKTDLELQLTQLRSELKSTQITNEDLQRQKSALELDIKNLASEKDDLKRQVEYNQKLIDSISEGFVRERNDRVKIQDSFKLLKNENTLLTRQLKSLNNRKTTLERKLQEIQEANAAMERRFSEMGAMLTDKLSQINELKQRLDAGTSGTAQPEAPSQNKESVELPPIVVRPQTETAIEEAVITLAGRILAVNKDGNFVIIDLGGDKGLKTGDALQVEREGKTIAEIEVIQTRKDFAACDIKKEYEPIQIGDTVR